MAEPVDTDPGRAKLRELPTEALSASDISAIRGLLWMAFQSDEEGFTEADWHHSIGGVHFLLDLDGRIAGHASVVERELLVGGRWLRTGYVEAVATSPDLQGRGFGSRLMERVTAYIRDGFEIGALGTGRHHFYERLGWLTWRGPSSVITRGGRRHTPDDDGFILVLATPSSPPLDLDGPIACTWRPGDVW